MLFQKIGFFCAAFCLLDAAPTFYSLRKGGYIETSSSSSKGYKVFASPNSETISIALPPSPSPSDDLSFGYGKKDQKVTFNYDLVKKDFPEVRRLFKLQDKYDNLLRYNGIKYIRDASSGKIFAIASKRAHSNAFIGEGVSGTIKLAIDTSDPTASVVVKKYARNSLKDDIREEAKNLKLLDLQYGGIDTPVLNPKSNKQYVIMKMVDGEPLFKFLQNPYHTPEQVNQAIEAAKKEMEKLHNKGYVHGDTHLGNFMVRDKGKTVQLIDAGNILPTGRGNPRNDKFTFESKATSFLARVRASEMTYE